MRRIAIALTLLAVFAGYWACSSDAPVPTTNPPGGGGGGTPPSASPVQIRLFTSNANPTAGACTLLQAIVTVNGANAPDGTGVSFSSDLAFATFAQNGLQLISVTTQGGAAVTAICSNNPGVANVRASATVGGKSGSATIAISFQPSAQAGPFFTSCSPSFGTNAGGTTLTIGGGRFPGSASSTRATFTAAGVTREALVTNVTPTAVTLVTPAFPEAVSPSVPVNITLTFNSTSGTPVVLTVPNCFAYGTASVGTPSVTAVLPSSGTNEGNTRVTIIGSGFAVPLQVFFGPVEATVLSVSYNQIVALTPPAAGAGAPNLNQTVPVRVHEVNSGTDSNTNVTFRFTPPVQIISFEGANVQSINGPFTPVTIHGQGFQAPVKVSLAGWVATVMSVSATEIVVLPGGAVPSGCTDISGPMSVTNIDTGDTATGQSFTYLVKDEGPVITSVGPGSGSGGTITITGANFTGVTSVVIAGQAASFSVNGSGSITATVSGLAPPACGSLPGGTLISVGDVVITNAFGCTATAPGAFKLPCVQPTPTPAPTSVPPTPTP